MPVDALLSVPLDRSLRPEVCAMRVLFTFENSLPSDEADAEVFVSTARHLAAYTSGSWLHVPAADDSHCSVASALAGMPAIRARAPLRPAALRHLCCGLTLVFRREFRQADVVYTRNLWVAWLAVIAGQRVVFDHYRPWPDQIPPLRLWIYRLISHPRLLACLSHSEYTRAKYLELGIPAEKLYCVRNGFDPQRLGASIPVEIAKRHIGVEADRKTVVYTGRVNHKKGLELVLEAARRLPDHLFLLVGSSGKGPIENLAKGLPNVRIVPWQSTAALAPYVHAADVLLIPPSLKPLTEFGSTVIPLKLYLYMGSGRPILAGDTPDVREVLQDGRNALLCRPDCLESLVGGIRALTGDATLAQRLGRTALEDSRGFTWSGRAGTIAAILERRWGSVPTERRGWTGAQFRAWLRHSRRWAVHLVRKRSWVLPPIAVAAPVAAMAEAGQDSERPRPRGSA